MVLILMFWLFLGFCGAIVLLILGELRVLTRVFVLWLICLVGGFVLAAPGIFVFVYHNIQQGDLLSTFITKVAWIDDVDPEDAFEFILVVGVVWVLLLPLFIIGSVLQSIMQSNLPSFIEDFQAQKAYEDELTQSEEEAD